MLTKKEFYCIRSLVEELNQLYYKLDNFQKEVCEPQIKEEFQKFSASVSNQKFILLETLKGGNYE